MYDRLYEKIWPFLYVCEKQIELGNLGTPILFRGYAVDSKLISEATIKYLGDSEGIFFDFFIHDFDVSRWLLGSDWKEDSVSAMGSVYEYKEFQKYNDLDNATCFAQFKNDAMAFYYCGRTSPHGYIMETEIIGTDAIYRIGTSPSKNLVEILDSRGNVKEEHPIFLDRFETAYLNEIEEFVNCILEKRKPKITIQDTLKSCEMAHLASQSFKQNNKY